MPKNGELGRIGAKRYGGIFFEEFVPELRGTRGVEAFREMSENDSTIGAVMFAIEMLIRQSEFMVEPDGKSAKDKEAAEFIESCLYDMKFTWQDTLSEIISFLAFGWSYHEIVYKRRLGGRNSKYDDKLIGWEKLPIRAQETLYEWKYGDYSDDLTGMVQLPPPDFEQIFIPIEKALHFRTKSRKDSPEGRSILRNAYQDWYKKKRITEIEGIGIERDLAGLPVLQATEDNDVNLFDTDDKIAMQARHEAEMIVTGLRRDEMEGVVLPRGWKLDLLSSGSRRQFDTNAIIDRYDKRIAMTVLADFILLGQQSVGSFALSSDKTRLFSLAIGTYLDIICEVFNTQAIPRLIDLNGEHFKGITAYPKMTHGDVEDPNLDRLGTFINLMTSNGIIVPDQSLENFVRRAGGLPERIDDVTPEERQQSTQDTTKKPQNDPQSREKPQAKEMDEADQKDAESVAQSKKILGRND